MKSEDEKPGYLNGGWKRKYYIQKWRQQICNVCVAGNGIKPAHYHLEDNRFCAGSRRGYKTYHCSICNGTGVKEYLVEVDRHAVYFVLRLDEDPHARKAARTYADSVEHDNPELALDIRARISKIEEKA